MDIKEIIGRVEDSVKDSLNGDYKNFYMFVEVFEDKRGSVHVVTSTNDGQVIDLEREVK